MKKTFLLLLILSLFIFCTNNPFFEDELDSSDGYSVSGQIMLHETDSQDGVYVWLESLGIGTYTDSKGKFNLALPLPIIQPGNGVSGETKLYFYLANYRIASSKLELLNGKILSGKHDINAKGRIKETISLQKLLHIRTEVSPNTMSSDYTGVVNITTHINPEVVPLTIHMFAGTVPDTVPPDEDNIVPFRPNANHLAINKITKDLIFDGLIYNQINAPVDSAIFLRDATILPEIILVKSYSYTMTINAGDLNLKEGHYEAVPYIEIDQDNVPNAMLSTLDTANPGSYSVKYLNDPCKRSGGFFVVNN